MGIPDLIREWGRRARCAQIGHYKTAVKLDTRYRRLGVTVASLNAIVGTTVFASLSEHLDSSWIRVVVGFVSMLTAVLAGVQTFERAGERAEAHRAAATQFSGLQREAERFLAIGDFADEPARGFVEAFDARYVQLVKESPTVDEQIHRQVKKLAENEDHPILGSARKEPRK